MTPGGTATLVLVGIGFLAGCWATVRYQRWRGRPAPQARPRNVARPDVDGKGWERTALYRWRGRGGVGPRNLLYAGISSDPQARTNQHALDPRKADMLTRAFGPPEVVWLPDRYEALSAEWALIDELSPPFNRRPSGTCDAWTEPRPPVVKGRVTLPSRTERWLKAS